MSQLTLDHTRRVLLGVYKDVWLSAQQPTISAPNLHTRSPIATSLSSPPSSYMCRQETIKTACQGPECWATYGWLFNMELDRVLRRHNHEHSVVGWVDLIPVAICANIIVGAGDAEINPGVSKTIVKSEMVTHSRHLYLTPIMGFDPQPSHEIP